MRTITIYEAEDGTQFHDEKICMKYEEERCFDPYKCNDIIILDDDGNKCQYGHASYLEIKTNHSAEKFIDWAHRNNFFDTPFDDLEKYVHSGIWIYLPTFNIETMYGWINVEDIKEIIEKFPKIFLDKFNVL